MKCLYLPIVGIYIYMTSGSTWKEAAMLLHHGSTVAQNVDFLRVDFTLASQLI